MTAWETPLFDAPLDVDWRVVGGDWDKYFTLSVGALTGGNIQSWRPHPPAGDDVHPVAEYRLASGAVQFISWLRLIPQQPKGMLAIVMSDERPSETEVEVWRTAVEQATVECSRGIVTFEWRALLGAIGFPTRLNAPGSIGAMRLSPADGPVRCGRLDAFEPIYLEGATQGSEWMRAGMEAGRDARLVAALLSVAWDVPISVQAEPQTKSEGEGYLTLAPVEAYPPSAVQAKYIPAWLETPIPATFANTPVSDAVLVYHEGLQLQYSGHPSFAFAAFIAALEAIGSQTVDLKERCSACNARTGAMKRFRTAIECVLTPGSEEHKDLKAGYELFRSSTVHTGSLHGGEERGGQFGYGNPFIRAPQEIFVTRYLPQVREVSRKVLQFTLQGGGDSLPALLQK